MDLEITEMSKSVFPTPWGVKRNLVKQGFHGKMHLGIVGLKTVFFNQSFLYAYMHWEFLEGLTFSRSKLSDHGNIFFTEDLVT